MDVTLVLSLQEVPPSQLQQLVHLPDSSVPQCVSLQKDLLASNGIEDDVCVCVWFGCVFHSGIIRVLKELHFKGAATL